MKDLLVPFVPLLTTISTLLGPCGARADVTDSLLMNPQLLVINFSLRLEKRTYRLLHLSGASFIRC